MTIEKGVKLVYKNGGKLTSFCAPLYGAITYPIGKWVGPKAYCGPLSVFDTVDHALQFVRFYYGDDGRGPLSPHYVLFNCLFVRSKYQYLWAGRAYKNSSLPFPSGTQFADSIKLLEEIDNCTLPS